MDSAVSDRSPGLVLRWVEVTDARGRTSLEMRWTTAAAEPATSATPSPSVTTPPITPHAA